MDGGADFSDFYLVVELEDNTPDATPPTVEYDGHYTGITSYIDGPRTLFLSIADASNPVDSSLANGPVLHYSTDGGNSYTPAASTLLSSCQVKNQICTFSATTASLAAGTTVDYYWTYSDAAPDDATKIPPQSANPGRFPASGDPDLTFTIGDIYSAPDDGTDMKFTTYLENIRQAETHTSASGSSLPGET